MNAYRSLTLALVLTSLNSAALLPTGAQGNRHTKFIASVRQAVKNPTGFALICQGLPPECEQSWQAVPPSDPDCPGLA